VGVDEKRAGTLATGGMFAVSRNPIYVSLDALFLGLFFIFPNPGALFVAIFIASAFHAQTLNEEKFCRRHYGEAYIQYCRRVRIYL
jgi:protein-S-isoprenylcysteine O-methyltransferase Ste14